MCRKAKPGEGGISKGFHKKNGIKEGGATRTEVRGVGKWGVSS